MTVFASIFEKRWRNAEKKIEEHFFLNHRRIQTFRLFLSQRGGDVGKTTLIFHIEDVILTLLFSARER